MSNILISLAAEFTGKKAFKDADLAAAKLNSNIKKLAGTFGIAFGAQALVQFSKAAVKAFAEDEAAANRLAGAVNNLGIGFANPAIADYIAKLEKSAAVADDILRPAFQGLLTTTGSLTQSQKLLSDAITISRGTGIELATVADDLGKAYIGITKGLTKYNTGLSKAELQSKSFSDILGVLLANSAGAAEDYLTTTSYKMDVLSIATSNASEIIGKGFVDALARASGGTEASDAAVFLETMAGLFNKVTLAAGTSIGAIPTLAQNLKKLGKNIFFGFVGKQAGVSLTAPENKPIAKLTLTEKKQQELLAKLEKNALAREKERLALINKQNTAKKLQGVIDKANLALGKGKDLFDNEAISLNAAMINQAQQLGQTQNAAAAAMIIADMQRLKIKQDIIALEDAIASKDTARIEAATKILNADIGILGALTGQNNKVIDIKSILDSMKSTDLINLANLEAALALLAKFKFPTFTVPTVPTGPGGGGPKTPTETEKPTYTIPKDTKDFTQNNPDIFKLIDNTVRFTSDSVTDAFFKAMNAGSDLPGAVRGANYQAQAEAQYKKFIDNISLTNQIADASLTQGLDANLSLSASLSGARYAAQAAAMMGGGKIVVTIVDKTSGLIEVVQNAVIENNRNGNSTQYAGAI